MNKLNYNETTQLQTRMAIIESQLEVANGQASNLKTQKKHIKTTSILKIPLPPAEPFETPEFHNHRYSLGDTTNS